MHVAKNIQILIFYFSCYYFMLSGNFLRLVNAGMGFFEVNFWSRDFFCGGGGGLSEALGFFFWRGVDFVPIRSSPSLEIFVSWKTFFLSLLCSDQFSSNCKLKLFTKPGSFPENK